MCRTSIAAATLFGKKLRIPVLCAPVGSLEVFEPGGGATVAEGDTRVRQRHDLEFGCRIRGWKRPPKPRATVSRSSSFMCAATPTGSTTMSVARSRMGYDAFCLTSTPTATAGASATSPSATSAGARAVEEARIYQAQFNWRDIERIKKEFRHPARS